ncbi:MAG: sulfite exporter TauE/SafE family protein [bacterium]
MAWRGRRHVELRRVRWILLGWIPGVLIGVSLLKVLSVRAVSLAMATFVLGAVALMTLGLKVRRFPPTEVGAGVLAGLGSLVSSISGPPVALLYKDERGPTLRANLALVFLAGVLLTLTGRVLSGEISMRDAQIALAVAPGVLLSIPISERLGGRVDGALLRRLVLGLATWRRWRWACEPVERGP